MHILISIFIAFGMAMDAFAVSLAAGLRLKKIQNKHALALATTFGLFHLCIPFIGWYFGSYLIDYISAVDHWIAFILLAYIGGRMIYSSNFPSRALDTNPFKLKNLLVLSIATSIDVFSVGLSLALIGTPILLPAVLMGLVTFGLSYIGVFLGHKTSGYIGKKAELIGGIILIGIGVKILIEHLYF